MSDETTARLEKIQAELATILEARLQELNLVLASTEQVARRIIAAEMEVERHRGAGARHQEQVATLEAEVAEARGNAQEIRERHAAMLSERDRAREDLGRLEREVREADGEVEQTRERVKLLDGEAAALRGENAALKTKLRTLEENIARMKRLKEELMSSITGLTQQMSGLTGGNE